MFGYYGSYSYRGTEPKRPEDQVEPVFDLLAYQRRINETPGPQALYYIFEEICKDFDRGRCQKYQWEELRDSVFDRLKSLKQESGSHLF